jgi:hypothetical protein
VTRASRRWVALARALGRRARIALGTATQCKGFCCLVRVPPHASVHTAEPGIPMRDPEIWSPWMPMSPIPPPMAAVF